MDYRGSGYFSGIYFIWNGHHVKIGKSISIRDRIATMQIENAELLKLIGFIEPCHMDFKPWLLRHLKENEREFLYKNENVLSDKECFQKKNINVLSDKFVKRHLQPENDLFTQDELLTKNDFDFNSYFNKVIDKIMRIPQIKEDLLKKYERKYNDYCREIWIEEEKKHQQEFSAYNYKQQWFSITVEQAREYIRRQDGILPLIHTIQTFKWEDTGDFFIPKKYKKK